MDGYGSLSTVSAVTILALVGLLVVASALALAPFDRSLAGRYAGAFVGSLAAIWALAALAVALIGGTP